MNKVRCELLLRKLARRYKKHKTDDIIQAAYGDKTVSIQEIAMLIKHIRKNKC